MHNWLLGAKLGVTDGFGKPLGLLACQFVPLMGSRSERGGHG